MVKRRATVSGKEFMVIATLDSGIKARLKDTEFILGLTVIVMRVNGKLVSDMEMEQTFLPMVMCIMDNMPMANLRVLASTSGPMVIRILVSLMLE